MPNFGLSRATVRTADAGQQPPPLNWRRGLLRLWMVASVGWIMGWAIYLIMDALQGGLVTQGNLLSVPVVLLGPPIALLLFGMATLWAFRGFTDAP